MVKLARNSLDLKSIISLAEKSISWGYLVNLYSMQQQEGVSLAN